MPCLAKKGTSAHGKKKTEKVWGGVEIEIMPSCLLERLSTIEHSPKKAKLGEKKAPGEAPKAIHSPKRTKYGMA